MQHINHRALIFSRRLISAVLPAIVCVGVQASTESAPEPVEVHTRKINGRVTVYTIEGLQATNVIVLNSDAGLIVVDAELSPVFAEAIRENIVQDFPGKPIRYLINTHEHGDHTYGNQVFSDAVIIGHDRCRADMIKNGARAGRTGIQLSRAIASMQARLENLDKHSDAAAEIQQVINYYKPVVEGLGDGFKLSPPVMTFSEQMDLYFGDLAVTLLYYGYSHSPSDIIVLCPEAGLMATGDLFYAGSEPYFDSERIPFIPRWKKTLETVTADTQQIAHIIPGHGDPLAWSVLAHYAGIIDEREEDFAGKESALFAFKQCREAGDLDVACRKLRELYDEQERYYFLYSEFDSYVFELMLADKLDEAAELFLVLADLFPESDTAFDSLGEVFLRKGEHDKAVQYFKKALELNPENRNARQKSESLQSQQ